MPGMIAMAGQEGGPWTKLLTEFQEVWPVLESVSMDSFKLAAHSHQGSAFLRDASQRPIAVDGERAIYSSREGIDLRVVNAFASISDGLLDLGPECRGNVATIDTEDGHLHFATEWTGTFPLFYFEGDGWLLVSSHLRPLARAVAAEPDMVGVLQHLRFSYQVAGRTLFKGIRRVLPGQALCYDVRSSRLTWRMCSRNWSKLATGTDDVGYAWTLLTDAAERCLETSRKTGVMLSGGWDSRTLLAALKEVATPDRLIGYSHGDTESRELKLVEQLAGTMGINANLQSVDDSCYELERLGRGFSRVENVVFPHWHQAGARLAQVGADTAVAGVFGEVLGGHYGPAMRLSGLAKIREVAKGLFGLGGESRRQPSEALRAAGIQSLQLSELPLIWTLNRDLTSFLEEARHEINQDLAKAIGKLLDRGVETFNQLVEAFVSEHRGTHYINMQLLSCRAHIDVALPYTDQRSLYHASCLPLGLKLHNRFNQAILSRHAHDALRLPLAATLVPAGRPIVVQEASRLIRALAEQAKWKLHSVRPDRFGPPRLGWVNFEFLRSGESLRGIAYNLRSDIWNHELIRQRTSQKALAESRHSLHPLSDSIMKVYSVDLMLA